MHNSTWSVDVVVVIGMDKPAALKRINKWIPDFSGAESLPGLNDKLAPAARVLSYGSSQHVLWIKYWPEKISDYGTLVHELFHIVDVSLRGKGITLSDDSDEAYAYFMGWIYQDFLAKLYSKKKK